MIFKDNNQQKVNFIKSILFVFDLFLDFFNQKKKLRFSTPNFFSEKYSSYLLTLLRKGTAFSLVILVTPCMYGTNTSGIVTEPSAF